MLTDNYIDVEQQSPEWLEMRKGMVTGSMVKHAVAKLAVEPKLSKKCEEGKHPTCQAAHCNCSCHGEKSYYQKCRADYMDDVVATRLTGLMPDRYVSKAMEEGIEREPDAIIAYEEKMDYMVVPGGFIYHPEIKWYGTSPDGLIGDDIVLEVKCPTQTTHMRYLKEAKKASAKGLEYVPEEYLPQVKAHLGCSGRPIAHFVSFNRDFPLHMRLLVTQWSRDEEMIREQEREVAKFLAEATELELEFMAV